MKPVTAVDPFQILGVPPDAGEAEIRARYLELVKQFPPERDPEKFREVREAYETAKDPLLIAQRLLEPPAEKLRPWAEILEEQRLNPPRLTPSFLLSLGNRAANDSAPPPTATEIP